MKKIKLLSIATVFLLANSESFAKKETLPCGLEEVLQLAANQNSNYGTPEKIFNNEIFSKNVSSYDGKKYQIDGLCTIGNNTNKAIDCGSHYYTYQELIKATKKYPKFACEGSLKNRKEDVAAFFANVAQETTAGISYTNDGLYYRGENAVENTAYDPNGLLVKSVHDTKSYCMQGSGEPYSSAIYTFDEDKLAFIPPASWINTCPEEYNTPMTDILGSGNWYGHGPMQLTGDSIFLYTAVYNTLHDTQKDVVEYANDLLNNDYIAWDSSLAYWNLSKPNQPNKKPPHYYMVANGEDSGFGESVFMVNGGCNNYEQRLKYYKYFTGVIFGTIEGTKILKEQEKAGQLTCAA